jgi:hypothetical protein
LLSNAGDAVDYHSVEMEGLDHDSTLGKIEMIGAIFEDVLEHAEAQAA